MQFSEQWLRSWVNPSLDTEGLCETLTQGGLEVEEVVSVAPMFSGVVVAVVKQVVKHPDAERLRVAYVDVGRGELLQIVCGAANLAIGQKVPCALPGAVLPGEVTIHPTKMRGILSNGMLCSGEELGIYDDVDGLLILPDDAAAGESIRKKLCLDDKQITLKITPNRADCLSIRGIAREVAALTNSSWTPVPIVPHTPTHDDILPVTLAAKSACGRYLARIIRGVNAAAPTPEWMKRRLERSTLRSVTAIVDVANYILLEQGQPMHTFDVSTLKGGITVRMAQAGEQLKCLNGKTVVLDDSLLVIADDSKPLAIAGIMGGEESAVTSNSQNILLESAFFPPAAIVGKARQLGLASDSAYRFERGVDFQLQHDALERATELILELCGGEAGPIIEAVGELPACPAVTVRCARVNQILGTDLTYSAVGDLLRRLGLPLIPREDSFEVSPPSFRYDLQIEEDLIEEVGRLYGYNAIPTKTLRSSARMLPLPGARYSPSAIRRAIAARGYQEVITYAFVAQEWECDFAANFDPIRLINPIASHLGVLRSTLIGSLLEVLKTNLNRKQSRIRLFELARVFRKTDSGVEQLEKLAALAWGPRLPEQWGVVSEQVDFYDVKADIDALLSVKHVQYRKANHPALHPGRCAQLWVGDRVIGVLGELHPRWVQRYDLLSAPLLFEIETRAIESIDPVVLQPVSKFPPISRDLALVVEEEVESAALIETFRAAKVPFVNDIVLFDVYRGQGIAAGKKSLAFQVLLQETSRTLTDEDARSSVQRLLEAVARAHGASLRA